MPYGIELTYHGETNVPVYVFDKDGHKRLASFETFEQATECAMALSYQITASHHSGWAIVDLYLTSVTR